MKQKIFTISKKLKNWSQKNRFFYLVSAFVLLVITLPFVSNANRKTLITTSLTSLLIIVSLFSTKLSMKKLKIEVLLGIITLITTWTFFFFPTPKWTYLLAVISTCLFFGFIIWGSIKNLITTKTVTVNLISAAITIYIMIAFLGAMICRALYTINSDSFIINEMQNDMATFLYFSFITITTIGYGDILPNNIFAKFTAMYLGIIGQLYLAIVMSIIIGKFLNSYRLDATKLHEENNDDETSTNQD